MSDGLIKGTFQDMYEHLPNSIRPCRVDKTTHSLQVIDYDHHEIHAGNMYYAHNAYELAINSVIDLRMTTPANHVVAHIVFEFSSEAECEYFLHEDAIISVAGTAWQAPNANRNSTNAAQVLVDAQYNTSLSLANDDTDIATNGIELLHGISGSKTLAGGNAGSRGELLLKKNTIYNFRMIAKAAGWISSQFAWYEHIAKD